MKHVNRATPLALIVALVCASCVGGCSWQQAYGAAQAWQRNACIRIMDVQERDRCLAGTSMSYDDYKRQAEAAGSAK